jgi:hypothetical protein
VTLIGQAVVIFHHIIRNKTTVYTEVYLNREIKMFNHDDAVIMQPGSYNYTFAFELPQWLPRSHGYRLTYRVEGKLDIPWTFMKQSTVGIEIKRHDKLNLFSILHLSRVKQIETKFFSFSFKGGVPDKVFRMTASIPCTDFVPGQIIKVKLRYENLSNVKILTTKVALKETTVERYETKGFKNRRSKKLVIKNVEGVNERDTNEVECELQIPLTTSQSDFLYSQALTIHHSVNIKAMTDGMHFYPKIMIPIIIGSEPLVSIEAHQVVLGTGIPVMVRI